MKRCLGLLLAITVIAGWAQADTTFVQGPDLSGVWTAAGSPYIVRGGRVSARDTLTIENGVRVFFGGVTGLRVDSLGVLNVLGAEGDSVVFTSDTNSQFSRRWAGIQIHGSANGCLFQYAVIEHSALGGVQAIGGDQVFSHCSFHDNHWWEESDDQDGGALKATDCNILISDCDFYGNSAFDGGAIFLNHGTSLLERCRIFGNEASASGDGIYCRGGALTIMDCIIRDNGTRAGGPGSGFYCRDASPIVAGTIIADNIGHAGVGCEWGNPSFTRCTITGNNGYFGTPNVYFNECTATLNSCVIARSQNGAGVHFTNSENSQVLFSNIFGNAGGSFEFSGAVPEHLGVLTLTNANGDSCDTYYNVYQDPMFADTVNGDYHLTAGSPCIDAGDPELPRDPDSTIADIGAYYYSHTVDVGSGHDAQPTAFILEQNYPNPFNAETRIAYELPRSGQARLILFDVTGRRVKVLSEGPQNAGRHTVAFNGHDLSSGVYYYRLETAAGSQTRKLLLLK